MSATLPVEELERLERAMLLAFETGAEDHLEIVSYGEMSVVVRWRWDGGQAVCKRLPAFDTVERADRYREHFSTYLERLRGGGIDVAPSELMDLPRTGGGRVLYCIQPEYPAEGLLPKVLGRVRPAEAVELYLQVVELIRRNVGPVLGLDAQLSNWVLDGGRLHYLDVTTPMLRDERGRSLLDARLFLAAAPPGVRKLLELFLLESIVDRYHSPRDVVLDVLANLYKEQLGSLIEPLLRSTPDWISPAIDERELRRYYRADARVWRLWQAARRADRWWHRVRNKPYPFLLPPKIERHL